MPNKNPEKIPASLSGELGRRQGRNFSGLVFDSDSADAFDAPCMRKRRDSIYRSSRSPNWIKVKN